jgi:hypothetical protein
MAWRPLPNQTRLDIATVPANGSSLVGVVVVDMVPMPFVSGSGRAGPSRRNRDATMGLFIRTEEPRMLFIAFMVNMVLISLYLLLVCVVNGKRVVRRK